MTILNIHPNRERARLGFKDAVLASYGFLCALSFRPVKEDVTFVRYESAKVFVNIYHGRSSYELGVEIGRLSEPEKKVTLYEIVAWAGAEKTEGFGQHVMFQASTREAVQECVPKLARLTQEYGTLFLKADITAYQDVRDVRSRDWAEYQKQVNLAQVRQKAEHAWHSKDYPQVVQLYGVVHEDLSDVEVKRLAYAERQVISEKK
ncbi:MAG TPA: hypothetical protein VJ723_03470 [Candidatus Angelobacter sp.]|nr:hypothetical protein [Candidatus Angelobacter sp.]